MGSPSLLEAFQMSKKIYIFQHGDVINEHAICRDWLAFEKKCL